MHAAQTRKGTSIPYVSICLGPAASRWRRRDRGLGDRCPAPRCRRGQRVTGGTPDGGLVGPEVLRIVEACSDSHGHPKPPWRQRKEAYLVRLSTEDASVLLVSASDKLHNARTILSDLRRGGPALWGRFSAGRDEELWYYRALVNTYSANPEHPIGLVDELGEMVAAIERLSA